MIPGGLVSFTFGVSGSGLKFRSLLFFLVFELFAGDSLLVIAAEDLGPHSFLLVFQHFWRRTSRRFLDIGASGFMLSSFWEA